MREHLVPALIPGLVLVFLLPDWTCGAGGQFPCGPSNVEISASGQEIGLTWSDDPSCFAAAAFTARLVVLVGNKETHQDEVVLATDPPGRARNWTWTSSVPLECVSHSVRLTYHHQNLSSRPQTVRTDPGLGLLKKVAVFPKDRTFLVGTRATFCCVLPAGEDLDAMYVSESKSQMNTTQLDERTFLLSADLNEASNDGGTNVKCDSKNGPESGTVAYIGYPPLLEDFWCETQDLESVVCVWNEDRKTHVQVGSATQYRLQGELCVTQGEKKKNCSLKVKVDVGLKNWTLSADNNLGGVTLSYEVDLLHRVHMLPPRVTTWSMGARDVSVSWSWSVDSYTRLNVTCEVKLNNTDLTSEDSGVNLTSITVNHLTPDSRYMLQLRCGAAQHFWRWSEWSEGVEFRTLGDVPDALDVWLQPHLTRCVVVWKELQDHQSHGKILDQEVTWRSNGSHDTKRRRVLPSEHMAELEIDPRQEFIIEVTARNINGSSAPSTIRTPVHKADRSSGVSRTAGSSEGFKVSWTSSAASTCGYFLEWLPASSHNATVDWMKVPVDVTKAQITGELEEGVRYLISIYACTPGAPELLETREGYTKEKRIEDNLFNLRWKQEKRHVVLSWDSFDVGAQSAFITGYTLYCHDNKNVLISSISSDEASATALKMALSSLSTYTFTLTASTAVGECGNTSVSATLNSPTDQLVLWLVFSLVCASLLLIVASVLCCRYWSRIKEKVLPPIPKPKFRGVVASLAEENLFSTFKDLQEQMVQVQLLHADRRTSSGPTHDYLSVVPDPVDLQNLTYDLVIPKPDQNPCGLQLQQALDKAQADPSHLTCCDSNYISAPM